jgi:hypothetical protein
MDRLSSGMIKPVSTPYCYINTVGSAKEGPDLVPRMYDILGMHQLFGVVNDFTRALLHQPWGKLT